MVPRADEDTWRRVWEIYAAAIELPLGEREAYVKGLGCSAKISSEVFTLLETDQAEAAPEPAREVSVTGERIGRYVLLSPLGRGGMGQVYSARDTELHRLVAMKFLKPETSVGLSVVDDLKREA